MVLIAKRYIIKSQKDCQVKRNMAMAAKLVLIFVFCFAAIIPLLEANSGYDEDGVWKKRKEEAKKSMMESYVPDPLVVTDEFDVQINQ